MHFDAAWAKEILAQTAYRQHEKHGLAALICRKRHESIRKDYESFR
jgi:hypothetical protein